jgi:hypothetical protein
VTNALPIPAAFDTARLRHNRGRGVLALLLAFVLAWAAWLHFSHTHQDPHQAGHDSRSICGLCVSFERGFAPPPQPPRIAAAVEPVRLAPPSATTRPVESRSERPRSRGPPLPSA